MSAILITGANGQLGQEMRSLSEDGGRHRFIFTDVEELDITDATGVLQFVKDHNTEFIVNCAAYTAVDKAEDNAGICHMINTTAVENLGRAASAIGAKVIHVSTDYVYGGMNYKPYVESDPADPYSVYGKTKLEGEIQLFDACPSSVVLRTSWLYSTYGNNFVKTMIRLGRERAEISVVADQIGTPTYAADLAAAIMHIIESQEFVPGVFNYSDEGACSWYDFTCTIHRMAEISCRVVPIESRDYPAKATRPFYSVMNKKKIKDTYGIEIPWWEESLRKCVGILMK